MRDNKNRNQSETAILMTIALTYMMPILMKNPMKSKKT